MHPPFRPTLAARANPKDGTFKSGDPSLAELSAFLDANFDLLAERRTAVRMLVDRGRPQPAAFRAVDNDIALAWFAAKEKGADAKAAKNAILGSLKKDRAQETRRASREKSLTGSTEEGDTIESDVAAGTLEEVEEDATRGLTAPVRAAMLASYSLTPQLFDDLRRSRKEDSVLAQEYGRSTKDITTLRAAASMLALHISREALMAADDLDDLIDALS